MRHDGDRNLAQKLAAKGDTAQLEELGIAHLLEEEPFPDWITYHTTAESMNCPPWEMFEDGETQPPKWWWRDTKMELESARNEAESIRRERTR